MATTTQVTVNKAWIKLSDSDCTVQALTNDTMQIAVSATKPTTDTYMQISLSEPATFAYQTAVWCRKAQSGSDTDVTINIIR